MSGLTAMKCLHVDIVGPLDEAVHIYLVDRSQIEYICLDISNCSDVSLELLSTEGQFADLREVDPSISGDDGSILAYAKAMCYWHGSSKYCSVCGHAATSSAGGHIRLCTNEDCTATHFPRTDAAVIVAVTFEDRILLGRQPTWPDGMLSVLAGFVEPGETLEHAVAREVFEEAGLIVKNVCYQHSQPWPSPASLMLVVQKRFYKLTIKRKKLRWQIGILANRFRNLTALKSTCRANCRYLGD